MMLAGPAGSLPGSGQGLRVLGTTLFWRGEENSGSQGFLLEKPDLLSHVRGGAWVGGSWNSQTLSWKGQAWQSGTHSLETSLTAVRRKQLCGFPSEGRDFSPEGSRARCEGKQELQTTSPARMKWAPSWGLQCLLAVELWALAHAISLGLTYIMLCMWTVMPTSQG